MSNGQKLWQIFREQDGKPADLSAKSPIAGVSRRTFLEVLGYSSAALALSGCRAPQQKIIPYLKQPVEFTPGVSSWFASVCGGCSASCGVLVKVRDGRPIKLEGNPDHPLSSGGLCALGSRHGLRFVRPGASAAAVDCVTASNMGTDRSRRLLRSWRRSNSPAAKSAC